MKTNCIRLAILTVSLLAIVACGKKSSEEPLRVGAGTNPGFVPGPSNLPVNQNMMPGQPIQVMPTAGAAITDAVKILMSPTIPANEIGNVTSIELKGDVSIDRTNGTLIPGNMQGAQGIQLTIVDSNVGQQPSSTSPTGLVVPMVVRVTPTSGGMANGKVDLSFRDATGEIRISGTYDNMNLTAEVTFVNSQPGYLNQTSGSLGRIQAPICSLVRCN